MRISHYLVWIAVGRTIAACYVFRRMLKAKSEKQRAKATLFQSAAQPGAQGDAGLLFGLFPLVLSARAP